ncbi:MAG: MBOAT family protein [Ruminococcaceae bacterium]|nr:MBOAT family protein [Oscillospiraceae bacterium]
MAFASYSFLIFLAALLVVYYTVPGRVQWVFLLAGSLLFYLGSGWQNLVYMLLTATSTYAATRLMERNQRVFDRKTAKLRNRGWLLLCLGLNFGLLGVCKLRLTFEDLLLPMGISFYMFQSMGYVLDVYRGSQRAEGNPAKLLLFVSYFPQLIQGPISRFSELGPRLLASHPRNEEQISFGLQRILWGYFKKLVIADRIAPAVAALRGPEHTGLSFLVLTVFYAIQIYGDFTGGIDIAIGVSETLGIRLPENFVRPFFSKNTAEYWRRWHITLGAWMKDYIFYPVSVSAPLRKLSKAARRRWPKFGKRLPVYAASLATWCCTGIWHGVTPNFLLWGLLNCGVIVISGELTPLYEKFHSRFHLREKGWYGGFEMLRTFFLMNLIRIVDLFPDVGEYFRRLGSLFTSWYVPFSDLGLTGLDYGILFLGCMLLFAVSLLQERKGSIRELLWEHTRLRYILMFLLFLTVLLMGNYGIGYEPGNFIYNQF